MVYKSFFKNNKELGYRYLTTSNSVYLSNYNGKINSNDFYYSIKNNRSVKDKIEFLWYLKRVLYF